MSKRNLALTGGVLLFLWVLGKCLAFAKDLLVSYHFGASYLTDAYFVASNVPALIYAGLYATVPLVLLPQYSQKLASEGSANASRFVSATLNAYAVAAVLISTIVFLFASELVYLIAPALELPTTTLAASLTRIFAITFLFSMISAVLTTVQLAHGQVAGTQLIPIVNNGVFILGVYFFAGTFGIYAAAIAATVAWILQTPLQWFLVRANFSYTPSSRLARLEVIRLVAVLGPALLSVSIDNLNVLASIFFGSRLFEGAISALSYAARLQNLCAGVFLVFTTSLLYPALSKKIATTGRHEIEDYLRSATRAVLLLAAPMSVVVTGYSHEIVELVFQRGAFGSGSTLTTASILMVLATAIPFIAVRDLYLRAIYALQSPAFAASVSLSGLAINVVVSYLLVDIYGTTGLAAALVVSSSVSCFICAAALVRLASARILEGLVSVCIKVAFLTFVGAATVVLAPLETWVHSSLTRLVAGTALVCAGFLLGYIALGLVSVRGIVRALWSRSNDL